MIDEFDDPLPIKKCVCFNTTFAEMKRSGLTTVDQIRDRYGSTSGCGICRGYIELMLRTGQTEFPILADIRATPDLSAKG